jgi:Tfp pilus assembly protein PilF
MGADGCSSVKPAPPEPAARHAYLLAAAVFLCALALYVATTAPNFMLDDNSEFIGAAHYLGVTHAPGYPLLSLFGKLFSFLAPGTGGFSVNLMAAFLSAGAVALAFRLLYVSTGWWAPSLLGAAMFATARLFWEEAGGAEVYPPNAFFVMLSLNIIWGLKGERRDAKRVVALGVVCLIASINHYTQVLVVPVYIAYLLWIYRKRIVLPFLWLTPMLLLATACFSVNMYLPLRSAVKPVYKWDSQAQPHDFYVHLKGVDRRVEAPRVPLREKWRFVEDYGRRVWRERTPFLLLLLPFGLWGIFARQKMRGAMLAVLWATTFLGFVFLLNFLYGPRASYVIKVFYVTSMQMLALILGFGAHELLRLIKRARLPWAAVFAIILALTAWSAAVNTSTADHSHNTLAFNYGLNMYRTAGRDAIVFSSLETEAFPLACLRSVYGFRRDITLHGRQGDDTEQAYSIGKTNAGRMSFTNFDEVEEFIIAKTGKERQVYFTKRLNVSNRPGEAVLSDGLLYHLNALYPKLVRNDPWKRIDMSGIDLKFPEYDTLEKTVVSRYLVMQGERYIEMNQKGDALMKFDEAVKFNPGSSFLRSQLGAIFLSTGDLQRAQEQYEASLAVDPENVEIGIDAVAAYTNLSYLYGKTGQPDKALEYIKTAVKYAPQIGALHANLGYTYWQQDKCLDAVDELEIAVRQGSESAAIQNILGICYEKTGRFPQAEKSYERALKLNPFFADTYRDYGIYNAYTANRPQRAIELMGGYLDIVKTTPDEPEIRANLGFLNQSVNKHEQAAVEFEKALALGAASTLRKKAIINGALAKSLEKSGKKDSAAGAYEIGLAGAKDYPEIYRDYAEFLDRNKRDPKHALELLGHYLAAVPNAPDTIKVELLISKIKNKK